MKSSPWIWRLLHTVKLTVKILSFFVAFSEYLNFNSNRIFLFPIFRSTKSRNFYFSKINWESTWKFAIQNMVKIFLNEHSYSYAIAIWQIIFQRSSFLWRPQKFTNSSIVKVQKSSGRFHQNLSKKIEEKSSKYMSIEILKNILRNYFHALCSIVQKIIKQNPFFFVFFYSFPSFALQL